MGAGFAFYVAAGQGAEVVRIAESLGVKAWLAGRVEAGVKQVVIEPLSLTFAADELHLRA